jgi:hypothetical protein
MKELRAFLSRLGAPLIRERWDRDLAFELDAYLPMLTGENIRSGMSELEARRAARVRLSTVFRYRSEA